MARNYLNALVEKYIDDEKLFNVLVERYIDGEYESSDDEMEAWLIYFKNQAEYNKGYIQIYKEEGKKLGVDIRLILVEELEFGVKNNRCFMNYCKEEIKNPDFVINRAIYPMLSRQLELMGIKVFNNSRTAEICNDKARTSQYLAKTGIRMVDTSFYRNFQIKEVLENIEPGTVIKAVDGHGGSQVFLINENNREADKAQAGQEQAGQEQASQEQIGQAQACQEQIGQEQASQEQIGQEQASQEQIIDKLGSSDLVIQPLTGSRHQDLRVYVIGKEIIAAVLRTSKEGFRANFSLGGEVVLYQLSDEEKAVINIIINQFDFGLVGIDFIIGDDGELIFNEIEDVVGARMLYQCSDINIAEKYLRYILQAINN